MKEPSAQPNSFDPTPGPENQLCVACGRWRAAQNPFIPMTGQAKPELVEVGEQPGQTEDRYRANFIGPAGNYLDGVEAKVGLKQFRIARINSVRCNDEENKPNKDELKYCRPFLVNDIRRANPRLVVVLGAYALRTLCGVAHISERQGTPIESKWGFTVLPAFHPANILRNPTHAKAFLESLTRAAEILRKETEGETKVERLRRRYIYVENIETAARMIAFLKKQKHLQYDTEYEPLDYMDPHFFSLGVSFSWGAGTGVFFPTDHPESPFSPEELAIIKAELAWIIENIAIAGHNLEGDLAVGDKCLGADIMKCHIIHDTMRGSMIVHGKNANHQLGARAYVEADTGGYDAEVVEWKKQHPIKKGYSEIPLDILAVPYAAGDTDSTAQLEDFQIPRIAKMGQSDFFYKVFVPGIRLNYIMRKNGMLVDWDQWNKRWVYWAGQKEEVYKAARAIPEIDEFATHFEAANKKKHFSLKSRDQLLSIFQMLKLPLSGRKTGMGGPSFDEAALLEIQKKVHELKHPHENFLTSLLRVGEIDKAGGTYCKGIAACVYEDGRVHPEWHNFTESHRRASKEPNVQNIPIMNQHVPVYDGKAGPDDPWNFRMLFRARPGYLFVYPDYCQIEMRTAANYSNDPLLLEACCSDDPHQLSAKRMNLPRQLAKTVNFLIIYGGSPPRLQAEVWKKNGTWWSLEQCEKVINATKKLYPGLWQYIAYVHEIVPEQRYVTTPLGHVRLLPHAKDSTDKDVRERAKREGWNHMNQSLGHDMLSMAMDLVQRYIYENHLPWYIENDIHDGFLTEVPEKDVPIAAKLMKHVMGKQVPAITPLNKWWKVPTPADIKTGTHMGNLEDYQEAA